MAASDLSKTRHCLASSHAFCAVVQLAVIVSAGADGSIRVWGRAPGHAWDLASLCASSAPGQNADQWQCLVKLLAAHAGPINRFSPKARAC